MHTPWGESQHEYKITDGVWEVDTAGHGGIVVRKAVASKLLSPAAIAKGWDNGPYYAYEEDCDWAIFAYEQPELYAATHTKEQGYKEHTPQQIKQLAYECLTRWNKDYLAQVEGAVEH